MLQRLLWLFHFPEQFLPAFLLLLTILHFEEGFFIFFLVFFLHGVLRPQTPYGLFGTGEEWEREREPRPTSLFTQLLVEVPLRPQKL